MLEPQAELKELCEVGGQLAVEGSAALEELISEIDHMQPRLQAATCALKTDRLEAQGRRCKRYR